MRADDVIAHVRGPAVLDVGCVGHTFEPESPFWLHGRLRARFSDVTGIDLDQNGLDKMGAAGFDQLVLASAETFDLDRTFDTVVAGELIEHLSSPGDFLERARAHINPGGQIVLTTPWPFSVHYAFYALSKYPHTCQNLQHVCWFCPATLSELASRCGLSVRSIELVADYDIESDSKLYRRSTKLLMFAAPLLPDRLTKNTMLVVLESSSNR